MFKEVSMRVYNETLDPNLWSENLQLDPEVRIALLKVGKDFYAGTDLKAPLIDIFLIGSSANYNWTPESDLDVHVVIDISNEGINPTYTRKFMDGLGAAWNKEHELEMRGHPVEVYLQDQTEPNGSPETFRDGVAVYSLLRGQWAVEPRPENIQIDKDKIRDKYRLLRDRINKLVASEDYTGLKSLMKKIKNYRAAGLKANGEFSTENLVFKALRHTGMLQKLKDGLKVSYDNDVNLDEVSKGPEKAFVITGTTNSDLDVVGEKYYTGLITHGQIRSKYGIHGTAQDWRYRSDINLLFWWGLPDEDEKTATKDYLATKFNVRNPKEVSAKRASDQLKQLLHYPYMDSSPRGPMFEIDESNAYYVVGAVTEELGIIAKRYARRDNYITHDQLKQQYGMNFGPGASLWRYHSLGNWIFWWEHPTPLQKEEVERYLEDKFGVVNAKSEYPETISRSKIIKEEASKKRNYLIVGLVNEDLDVVAKRDFGRDDEWGSHSVEHGSFEDDPQFRYRFNWESTTAHWRYKSKNNTLYWWPGDIMTERMLTVVLDYLHTKWNAQNPKVVRSREAYFTDAHVVNEEAIPLKEGEVDRVYFGNVDDDNHVNSVRWFNVDDKKGGGNHFGEGNRWRYRTTYPYVFWWDDHHRPTEEQKDAVNFYLYQKFGIKPKGHKHFTDVKYSSAFAHGCGSKRHLPADIDESKFNPAKAKELQFVTYGGLSLTKQKGYRPDQFSPGSLTQPTFHQPPARKGIYAFVWPYVEKFLLGGDYADPKVRGKGQRQRIQYVKDKHGNVVTSDHPEFSKHSNIPKNWSFSRKRPSAPGHERGSDEFEYDKEYYNILYRNNPRKKFTYNGDLWHHLKDGIPQDKIIDEKGAWVKTDIDTYREALLKELHSMHAQKVRSGYGTTLDHMEVFIDSKI